MKQDRIGDRKTLERYEDRLDRGTIGRVISTALGGSMIALGLSRKSVGGAALAAIGGYLTYEGASGHGPLLRAAGLEADDEDADTAEVIAAEKSLTVARPRDEVYGRWRRLEDLPDFMRHLDTVTVQDERRSHWKARVPGGHGHLEWEAEITDDQPGERLAWRSLPGATVFNSGAVRFGDAPSGQGTEVHVRIEYRPPGGPIGSAAARLLNPAFAQMVKEDIRRFKQLMETGEIPTTEGQPEAR